MTVAARPGTGRPRRRFPVMSRIRASGLTLTSVSLLVAAIIGVQLGRSAISEINPIHFQGAVERPQGITPPPEPAPFNPYAQPYVWSLPPGPSLVDCAGDCDTVRAHQATQLALDESAGRDASLPYWRDSTPTTELRPWPPGEMPNAGPPLERYMRYPVNREQAERGAARPAAASAPAPAEAQATPPAEALRLPPAVADPVVEE